MKSNGVIPGAVKKGLAAVLAGALGIGGIAGGMVVYRNANKKPVNVISVSNVSYSDYWGDETTTYGIVRSEGIQQIMVSSTQKITEIYVEEGQELQVGDKILSYDTTLKDIDLRRAELTIQRLEMELEEAEKELRKIQRMSPSYSSYLGFRMPLIEEEKVIVLAYSGPLNGRLLTETDEASAAERGSAVTETEKQVTEAASSQVTEGKSEKTTQTPAESSQVTTEEAATEGTTEDHSGDATTEAATEEITEDTTEDSTEDTSEESTEETSEETTEEQEPGVISGVTRIPNKGNGTKDAPYEYLFPRTKELELTQSVLAAIIRDKYPGKTGAENDTAGSATVYAIFEVREDDKLDGEILQSWSLKISEENGKYSVSMYALDQTEDPTENPTEDITESTTETTTETTTGDPEESTEDTEFWDDPGYYGGGGYGSGYTSAELAAMRSAAEERIRDLKLDLELARLDLEEKTRELEDGTVYCTVAGVVKAVRDSEEAYVNSEPVVEVSGGGGYYITGSMSEMHLDSLKEGDSVKVTSWESGVLCYGTVSEISEIPTSDSSAWSDGNTNVSYYPFTVFVEADQGLTENEYVEMSYASSGQDGNYWYLQNEFIRTDAGQSYVFVMNTETGKLEKRVIATGKALWGSYTMIKGGLSMDDCIAFPYGDAEEGAKAQLVEASEFYGY